MQTKLSLLFSLLLPIHVDAESATWKLNPLILPSQWYFNSTQNRKISPLKTKLLLIIAILLLMVNAHAGSATWNLNPVSSDWNTAANWTPATVPRRPGDTATFAASNERTLSIAANTEVDSIIFTSGASPFEITVRPNTPSSPTLTISGAGVINESGIQQSLVADNGEFHVGSISFTGSASAGTNMNYTAATVHRPGAFGPNSISFTDNSSAENANFTIEAPHGGAGGQVIFSGNATAANATIFNQGFLGFNGGATAADAVITDDGGILSFSSGSAGNAVITQRFGSIVFFGFGATAANGSFTLDHSSVSFDFDTLSAGNALFTLIASSANFTTGATAERATFIAAGGTADGAAASSVNFRFVCSAGKATFVMEGGQVAGALGSSINFSEEEGVAPTAADATVTLEAGQVPGALGAVATFSDFGGEVRENTTAGNATIIANGGLNGAGGGSILLEGEASGGNARFEVFGNGSLDVSSRFSGVEIGSLEGDGLVFLGTTGLRVGANNLDTIFSGTLQDGGGIGRRERGSLIKLGTGKLTLAGVSTYTDGTTVDKGVLNVVNTSGSATGDGAVLVNVGTLAGSGIIAGAVTVGTGRGAGAFLAPAAGTNVQATLTLQSNLTLQSDATYACTFASTPNGVQTDLVIANGVAIADATIGISSTTPEQLAPGMVLTVISNTSANPISGTFSNLADGAVVTVNGNNLQASYSGGDGNDLTLTVIP